MGPGWLAVAATALLAPGVWGERGASNVGGRLRLEPAMNGVSSYVRAVGEALLVTCRFEAYTDDKLRSLEWRGPGGDRVTGDEAASVRVQSFGAPNELSLLFARLAEGDEGAYQCLASVANSPIVLDANVLVIRPAEWEDEATEVGGMVGERLFVDCRATGQPRPSVAVTNGYNQPFRDARFSVADSRLTIDPLQEADEGHSLICTAAQAFHEERITNVRSKTVRLHVWIPPRLNRKKIDFYAIPGRNGSVRCKVDQTNPPIQGWTFFKAGVMVKPDGRKYRLSESADGSEATLQVAETSERDMGDYKCVANNGKSSGELYVTLRKALAPGPVEVALAEAEARRIRWRVRAAGEEGELPVTHLCVKTLTAAALARAKGHLELSELWHTSAKNRTLPWGQRDGLYVVDGLRPSTKYVFRFSAVNEAGWGDFFQLSATTPAPRASASPQPFSLSTLAALTSLLLLALHSKPS